MAARRRDDPAGEIRAQLIARLREEEERRAALLRACAELFEPGEAHPLRLPVAKAHLRRYAGVRVDLQTELVAGLAPLGAQLGEHLWQGKRRLVLWGVRPKTPNRETLRSISEPWEERLADEGMPAELPMLHETAVLRRHLDRPWVKYKNPERYRKFFDDAAAYLHQMDSLRGWRAYPPRDRKLWAAFADGATMRGLARRFRMSKRSVTRRLKVHRERAGLLWWPGRA